MSTSPIPCGRPLSRRDLLITTVQSACGVGLIGFGLGLYAQHATALPAWALRPPGAQPEDDFNGICLRCGLCVRACPFEMLHLARLGQPITTGTPYFIAREAGCEMCPEIPCVTACPSNALNHDLTDIRSADMGLAVLIDPQHCLAVRGEACQVCVDSCPISGDAISLAPASWVTSEQAQAIPIPVIHPERCTGCGKCEETCVLDQAAIKILPRALCAKAGL
ncbi:MAG: MauM/NapG family ferredoxin-type protein [Thiohalocapsa sp. PB-PSB1]|jgi:ferredoxin-type protein NapG|nr:MAG: hypothetical protein N838_18005 [Thiohalocapsa sp. PB-PSB1]QQO56432.1 MAG: MauM/NapG family ferredoxin-type protein [Thiohalocapsa sp. PB-PSB1]HCS90847.1 MauM/NapG family ferredoxin-type protein [Chromatiaceae bacterium]